MIFGSPYTPLFLPSNNDAFDIDRTEEEGHEVCEGVGVQCTL